MVKKEKKKEHTEFFLIYDYMVKKREEEGAHRGFLIFWGGREEEGAHRDFF